MATLVGPGLHPQYTSAFGEASGDPSNGLSDTKRTGSPGNNHFFEIGYVIFRYSLLRACAMITMRHRA